MRERVTLTLDPALTLRAKQLAKARGISLSRLIENSLREVAIPPGEGKAAKKGSFAERWRGKFALKEGPEPRREYLLNKYG